MDELIDVLGRAQVEAVMSVRGRIGGKDRGSARGVRQPTDRASQRGEGMPARCRRDGAFGRARLI